MAAGLLARALEALRAAGVLPTAAVGHVVVISPSGIWVERRSWAADALRARARDVAHQIRTTRVREGAVLVVAQDDRGAVRVEVLELGAPR